MRRALSSCTAAATSSLPVPLSPLMSTVAREDAICSTASKMARIAGLSPMTLMSPRWLSGRPQRRIRRCSISRVNIASSCSISIGLIT